MKKILKEKRNLQHEMSKRTRTLQLNFEADLKYPTSCLGGGGAQFTNKLKTF